MSERTRGRVKVPKNPGDLLDLAKVVGDKHQKEGTSSPLKLSVDYNWDELVAEIDKCKELHTAAEDFKRKMEETYRERDISLPNIESAVRAASALLKGVYAKNPKRLGDWGFNVDDTKQKGKEEDK